MARLSSDVAQSNELRALPAFAPRRLATTLDLFLDLVLSPLMMWALVRQKFKPLREELTPHVARSVTVFLAASRHSGVNS